MTTLEKQVVSLELAKRLKGLGVPQKSVFYWTMFGKKDIKAMVRFHEYYPEIEKLDQFPNGWHFVSALTVAELGALLPEFVNSGMLTCDKISKKRFEVYYTGINLTTKVIRGSSEAETRALMLIYLLENNLITL